MRNLFATLTMILGLFVGLLGMGLHWLHRAVHTPEPTASLVQATAEDQVFRDELGNQLLVAITAKFPSLGLDSNSMVADVLQEAVAAVLDQPQVVDTLTAIVTASKDQLVADLSIRSDSTDPQAIVVDLAPLLSKVWSYVDTNHPVAAQLLTQVELPDSMQVPIAELPAKTANSVTQLLNTSNTWWQWYLLSAGLLASGILLATSPRRWGLYLVIGIVGIAVTFGLQLVLTLIPHPNTDNTILDSLVSTTLQTATGSISQFYNWAYLPAGAFIVAGLLGWVLLGLARSRL